MSTVPGNTNVDKMWRGIEVFGNITNGSKFSLLTNPTVVSVAEMNATEHKK